MDTPYTGATRGFVWTDEEVELLLRVTLEYKNAKYRDHVDWETVQSKYKDIHEEFVRQYPRGRNDDFPHSGEEITSKSQITSKLKAVRTKYRKAMGSGKRKGQGRVILIYYELCQLIWGGPPATETIAAGLETADYEFEYEYEYEVPPAISRSSTPLSETQESSDEADTKDALPPVVSSKRDALQATIDNIKENRKRKLSSDPAVEEDLQLKRRMLEFAEEAEKNNKQQMEELTREMKNIHDSINEGLSMLRELMRRSQPEKRCESLPAADEPATKREGEGEQRTLEPKKEQEDIVISMC
ncbi:unnamed protein product [Knipowitschia caucasica]